MKRFVCLLLAGLAALLPYNCPARAEAAKVYTGQVSPVLPGFTITVTDTGEDTTDGENILCAAVCPEAGGEGQQLYWHSVESPAFERRTAMRYLTRGTAMREPSVLRVANVDWVNLRSRDSKASPSLAKLNAGEEVIGLVFGCGQDSSWTLVWQPPGTLEEVGKVGYIWHSFLEPVAGVHQNK